ncbi:hypothetical protein [Rhodopila sp.]|uniref:hypothetical protein n=1 Tax=Rhodopila sp. TaxID=2480087 RepID=UPI003D0DD664
MTTSYHKKPRPPAYRMFTMQQVAEASELQAGYCLACGNMRDCCEPDAREYECEECHELQVYGAEELIIMGRVQ